MHFIHKVVLVLVVVFISGCTSIKEPYSTILHTPPSIVKTSVGSVEVWKWESNASSKGTAYLIPGFPGSSLENATLGRALEHKGYSVRLLNPPGHGQINSGSPIWNYSFPQYGKALHESIQQLEKSSPDSDHKIIIAHSTGAEMVFNVLVEWLEKGIPSDSIKLILINPWIPSISNHPLPWTEEDEEILNYPPLLVQLFGQFSKAETHQRLFNQPENPRNVAYLNAHEKLSENFGGWWPFDQRFVGLLRGTTKTQKEVLQFGKRYELSMSKSAQLNSLLKKSDIKILVINSSQQKDKVIPLAYKNSLKQEFQNKLPDASIKYTSIAHGGHMLQIERLQEVLKEITNF